MNKMQKNACSEKKLWIFWKISLNKIKYCRLKQKTKKQPPPQKIKHKIE